jgi:hypothetical protein
MPAPQWNRPEPVQTFSIGDLAGETVIWIHGGYHEGIVTRSYGVKPAVRGTWIVLTGRQAGEVIDDSMIFSAKLLSQVRAMVPGTWVLGRIAKQDKSITLDIATGYDENVANQWVAGNPGRLERLAGDAVRTFAEEARKLTLAPGAPGVAPSVQWQPTAPPPPPVAPVQMPPQGPPNAGAPVHPSQAGYVPQTPPQADYGYGAPVPPPPTSAPPQSYGPPPAPPTSAILESMSAPPSGEATGEAVPF